MCRGFREANLGDIIAQLPHVSADGTQLLFEMHRHIEGDSEHPDHVNCVSQLTPYSGVRYMYPEHHGLRLNLEQNWHNNPVRTAVTA